MSTMTVSFPGGKRVDAEYGGFTIRTDQAPKGGGEGSAPQPFDLFLASIATCAGIYVKGYCDARALPTDGLGLTMHVEHDPQGHRVARLALEIRLPLGFPDTHRDAIVRAADLCAVKKHIHNPPAFEIRAIGATEAEAEDHEGDLGARPPSKAAGSAVDVRSR
jgi:ribosomal protein S12 methylthiotransferase accessory factor